MVKYQIYTIFEKSKDIYNVYIGSTKQGLKRRISKHLTDMRMFLGLTDKGYRNYRSSFDVLVTDKYKCQVIDTIDTDNQSDVFELESMYILKYLDDCNVNIVNKILPNSKTRKKIKYDFSNLNNINFNKDCEYKINKDCSQLHYTNFLDTKDN